MSEAELLPEITNRRRKLEEASEEGTSKANTDEILKLRDDISVLQRKLKAEAALLEDLIRQHIDAHGDIEIGGGQRLYVGNTRIIKSIDDKQVFQAVLDAAGGDLSVFQAGAEGVLVSQPWKSNAVHKIIGDELFYTVFFVETVKDLKTGRPKRSVKLYDSNF